MYNKIIGYKYVIGNYVKYITTKHENNFKNWKIYIRRKLWQLRHEYQNWKYLKIG